MKHGFAGFNERGKVQDAVEGASLGLGGGENLFKGGPVCQLTLNEINAGGQKVAPAMAQIVKNHGLVPIFNQQASDITTYVPRTASYEDFHEITRPSQTSWYSLKSNM
jgi:hypothetical protein